MTKRRVKNRKSRLRALKANHIRSAKAAKMPMNYHQSARAAKRDADIAYMHALDALGQVYLSRHLVDPEGSARWVETGKWEA